MKDTVSFMEIKDLIGQFISNVTPYGIHEYKFISPDMLTFSEAVRQACAANLCGRYGKSWACPPGAGDWQVLRDRFLTYKNAFIYTTVHEIEDSFDFEGMAEGGKRHSEVDNALLDHLKDTGVKFELAGAGSCDICGKCTYPDAPCRHPDRMRHSMEACGMDVVQISRDAGIKYINGQNTVTYFSILFW